MFVLPQGAQVNVTIHQRRSTDADQRTFRNFETALLVPSEHGEGE
jgi:hypothetical protein